LNTFAPSPELSDQALAKKQDISIEAVQLARASEIIDLHIEGYLVPRLAPYDPYKHHGLGWLRGRLFGHLDFPRILEGSLSGAMWSITTNPSKNADRRWTAFLENLEKLRKLIAGTQGLFEIVSTHGEYLAARKRGAHACLLAIQGGNAVEAAPDGLDSIPGDVITRITLVHLTSSAFGVTSSPLKLTNQNVGLSTKGKDFVRAMNAKRILVDLAHINPAGFWDAHKVHDQSQPLIATHTGVSGVKKHWRNLDDDQVKAIANTGGTIGIIYAQNFLKTKITPADGAMVVAHMQHVIDLVGDDFVSIGSDYDGMIVPPPDLRCGSHYPRLVQHMLTQGWAPERIEKVLGLNALRVFAAVRP
jgi:membrane dipeptidase